MMPRSRRPRKPYRPPAEVPAALAAKRERDAARAYIMACAIANVDPGSAVTRRRSRHYGVQSGDQ
jgi:hypothetical protein